MTDDPDAFIENTNRLHSIDVNGPVCGPQNDAFSVLSFTNKDHKTVKVESLEKWPRTIMACRLPLDGAEIKNTVLNYVVVEYNGGLATLDNVRLFGVLFDMPHDSPNARKLADAVLRAEDNIISISLE